MSRHPHADLMIAYANDTSLQFQVSYDGCSPWQDCSAKPAFDRDLRYRIKPKPKKAYVFLCDNGSGKWASDSSIDATIAEDERNACIRAGFKVTEIEEVVFE